MAPCTHPGRKRLFRLKAKIGLGRFAPTALPHHEEAFLPYRQKPASLLPHSLPPAWIVAAKSPTTHCYHTPFITPPPAWSVAALFIIPLQPLLSHPATTHPRTHHPDDTFYLIHNDYPMYHQKQKCTSYVVPGILHPLVEYTTVVLHGGDFRAPNVTTGCVTHRRKIASANKYSASGTSYSIPGIAVIARNSAMQPSTTGVPVHTGSLGDFRRSITMWHSTINAMDRCV